MSQTNGYMQVVADESIETSSLLKSQYSSRVHLSRKNSLSLKQKPVMEGRGDRSMEVTERVGRTGRTERLDKEGIRTTPDCDNTPKPNIHRLKTKQPFISYHISLNTSIPDIKSQYSFPITPVITSRLQSPHPLPPTHRPSNEIQQTVEYQKWLKRHRKSPQKENSSRNCNTPRHVNIFVKFTEKSSKTSLKKKQPKQQQMKKRSIAIA